MKISLALVFVILVLPGVHGQILKVDKGDIMADSSGYFLGGINVDYNVNNRSATADKEVVFTGFRAKADLVYVGSRNAYILINDFNYFKSTGGPLISNGYSHFRVNWLRKRTLSYETYAQIQYDDGRSMPLRQLVGGGVRWSLARDRKHKLHVGTGLMWEYEEWKTLGEESVIIDKEIIKNSTYVGFKTLIYDYVSFNGVAYYQVGYDDESDVYRSRYSGDLALSFKLTNNLSFSTSFTAQYENRPIIDIPNWVYSLTNGLKWEF